MTDAARAKNRANFPVSAALLDEFRKHFGDGVKLVYAKENGLEIGEKRFGEAEGSVWVIPCIAPKMVDTKGRVK